MMRVDEFDKLLHSTINTERLMLGVGVEPAICLTVTVLTLGSTEDCWA